MIKTVKETIKRIAHGIGMVNESLTILMDRNMNTTIMDIYIKFGSTWVTITSRNVTYII